MTEVLSQDEIDQLLAAINASCTDGNTSNGFESFTKDQRKIKIYDFKRPDKFNKIQIRTFCDIFCRYCRDLNSNFNNYFKHMNNAHFHVAVCDQLTYEEFIRSIPTPSTLFTLKTSIGKVLVELDPAISFELLSCVTGISNEKERIFNTISGIQYSELVVHILNYYLNKIFLKDLDKQFSLYIPNFYIPEISLVDMYCYPNYVDGIALDETEMGLLVTIESVIGNTEGLYNIFLPYHIFSEKFLYDLKQPEYIKNAYMTNKFPNLTARVPRITPIEELKTGQSTVDVQDFSVDTQAVLGSAKMTIKELTELSEGSIVELDSVSGDPVNFVVQGKVVGKGEVVLIDEKFALRIVEINPIQNINNRGIEI